jgi:sterol desaturase/sphingolipid hydroxylase (fatty acid hydroxylase superfamily)
MSDFANWFGMNNGKFIGEPPSYVNKSLKPGLSEVPKPTLVEWIQKAPTVLVKSPNFVWAVIALLMYGLAPYDLAANSAAATGPLTSRFFWERFPLWFSLVIGYDMFWHLALYAFKLAKRPFLESRIYSFDKVVHNIFWTTSGLVIWTGFENVMCYIWATGRLSYIPDTVSFGSVNGFVAFILALGGVPLWRSIHFYFAHRFIHMDDMYKQVHSLHHRNTDTEPFSGLCMHPVEHLYYYACILPSLVFYCSPFAFLWNGVHLLLSPGASHSGYEDHFQSDVFHYMHHRYFECNYAGTDASFLDIWFGTFQGSFREGDRENPAPREDAKSSLQILPSREFMTYLLGSGVCFVPWLLRFDSYSATVAILAGFGPVALASIVSRVWGTKRGVVPAKMSFLANALHVLLGMVFCSMPVASMIWLSLRGVPSITLTG